MRHSYCEEYISQNERYVTNELCIFTHFNGRTAIVIHPVKYFVQATEASQTQAKGTSLNAMAAPIRVNEYFKPKESILNEVILPKRTNDSSTY